MSKSTKHVVAMELGESRSETAAAAHLHAKASNLQTIADDDRYPGSFFRIPGIPVPGKTTWSLVK